MKVLGLAGDVSSVCSRDGFAAVVAALGGISMSGPWWSKTGGSSPFHVKRGLSSDLGTVERFLVTGGSYWYRYCFTWNRWGCYHRPRRTGG